MVTGLAFALVLQQRVDVPAGLHTLGEIAEHATKAGIEVVVAPLEADRMFAARLVDMEPIAALRAVVSAAGDLEIKAETKEDKTVFKVQADQAVRAKNDAIAARIFNELLADFRKSLIAVREEAIKLRGLKIEERQPIARQLQAEYDFIYEQWDKDRTDLALRKKLLELTPPLYAHTLAGEVWNMFPLEALHNIGNMAPRNFRDVEQWQARLSEMPRGFARLRTLSALVPGREALQDVVFEFKVGSTPNTWSSHQK